MLICQIKGLSFLHWDDKLLPQITYGKLKVPRSITSDCIIWGNNGITWCAKTESGIGGQTNTILILLMIGV